MAIQNQTEDTKAHFDRLSGTWSRNYHDLSGAMRQRIVAFSSSLSGVPHGARVLDFGCGSGDITRALAAEGFVMTGIDLSPAMIAEARRAPGSQDMEWVVANPGQLALPFADETFAAAIASSVFEYHPDCAGQLREIFRIFQPGGTFAFTVPDMNHPMRRTESWWRALAQSSLWPLLRLTPRRDYLEYLRVSVNRWPMDSWMAMVRSAGFDATEPESGNMPLAMIICRKPA